MRQCQLVLDLLDITCKICKLLSFFDSWVILRVLLVAGTSSEGDGPTRQFRGYFNAGCPLSGCVGVFCVRFSASFTIFGTCRVGYFESHISNFSSKFCNFVRQLLDVTSSSGCDSLSSSTNGIGCLRLGCHHLVLLFWC